MSDNSRGWLFRKRTVLGAALVAGAIVGMYLPDFWKGFGGGSTTGVGIGDSKSGDAVAPKVNADTKTETDKKAETDTKAESVDPPPPTDVPRAIKVSIDDRKYFLRSDEGDREAGIDEIIRFVKVARGDADGIRVRIYCKKTARTSAEVALQEAFNAAAIPDTAVYWYPGIAE